MATKSRPQIHSHNVTWEEYLSNANAEARLIHNVLKSANLEGKGEYIKVEAPKKGWHRIEFYWKPKEDNGK